VVILAFALFGVLGLLCLIGLGIALVRTSAEKAGAAERQQAVLVEFQAASRRRRAGAASNGSRHQPTRQPVGATIH
jgi:hypothetical protein